MADDDLDRLIVKRLYWQLPIIAMRARNAARRVIEDAQPDPEIMHKPVTVGVVWQVRSLSL